MKSKLMRCTKVKTFVNMMLRSGHYRWQSEEYYGRLTPFQERAQ